jgi:outer membrane protein assembly factor BamB
MHDYSGVHAIDWNTGKINWTYISPTPYAFETAYQFNNTGVYSWHGAGKIADGKLYIINTEHTPSQPLTRGWKVACLNAHTGELIWNMTAGEGVPGSRIFMGAIADGYFAYLDEYDNMMYVHGKGKSTTTITAPDVSVPHGTPLMLKGTVLDLSPAQPGTPCVSAASMTTQMEYLHKQRPIDGLNHDVTMTGVPVSLDTVDPNNNNVHIADVTTDAYTGTFGYTWTPEVPGQYTVTARFAGDDSYGSSFATTYVHVGPAPEPYPEPVGPALAPDYTPTIVGTGIAIIIAVAIVGMLILRRRP